ncbi:hypothetical protein BOTBODRAFT_507200 [Botryobasidium botryosum FD-172 SS1]|uniref:Protein kinase domain-containing protein n=1 Tax=Botryobasidium botryosum (strain FD-172 SS1) TaxID=930990 RepID=A0A067M5G0_BOTB1|nr:hypothetical protein BOTBODRAFT_507200 [Botryobasidium botryosum FD-172 SS1]
METYASYTHFDSFIYQFNIADDVEAKLKHLDHTLARFELATTAITQDLAAARETDFGDLGEALRGQARLKNTTRENRVALDRVLGGLQTLLRQQAPGPAQEQTKSRIFIIQSVINVGLPETKLLSGIECQKTGSEPVVGTNAYEIWQGLWMGRQKVALKVLRQSNFDELESGKSRKRLMRWERRIDVWSKLHNEYILPLYGICYDDGPFPYLVSPWCPNGDANRYLKDKSAAERLKICLDAARGLQYLHSLEQPVIYGTMSGGGILISNDGRALLADFGVPSATDILSPGDGRAGNSPSQIYRWMAPEMQSSTNTKSTDIWSWGMTTVELVSGKQPFPSFRMPGTILLKIAQGERPNPKEHDPAVLRGELWSLLQSCWHKDPEERPNIDVVVKKMEAIVDAYRRA